MQYQGRADHHPPLTAPPKLQRRLRNYCGSLRWSRDGSQFAVSSPRGGLVTFWGGGENGAWLGMVEQADVCGIAASGEGGFWISDGNGGLTRRGPSQLPVRELMFGDRRWDNHLVSWEGDRRSAYRC